jgi:hypothetical protein
MSGDNIKTADLQAELAKEKLCKCCEEAMGKHIDHDLDGWVCDDCQTKLRWAQARLKTVSVRGCIKTVQDTAGNRIGDNL